MTEIASLLPIDVGFDLKARGTPVTIPAERGLISVRFVDEDDSPAELRDAPEAEAYAALRAAGYAVAPLWGGHDPTSSAEQCVLVRLDGGKPLAGNSAGKTYIPLPFAHSPLTEWTPCGHGCAPAECPGGNHQGVEHDDASSRHGYFLKVCPTHGEQHHLTYLGGRCEMCAKASLAARAASAAVEGSDGAEKGAAPSGEPGDASGEGLSVPVRDTIESLTVAFTPVEGITLLGTTRAMAKAIKGTRSGWKWWRDGERWYLPRTRDTVQNQGRLESLATDLRRELSSARIRASVRVQHSLEGGVRPAEEREADRKGRAESRAERLDDRADKLSSEAGSRHEAARRIADGIPMGQPILVGHHSEKRHRRDIARIRGGFEKAAELSKDATETRHAAKTALDTIARAEKPGAILRKVERLEAERRKIDRDLSRVDLTDEEVALLKRTGWFETAKARHCALVDEIGHLRSKLEGVDLPGPAKYAKGQTIESGHGPAVILRVNPKSLTVQLVPERRFISPPDGIFKVSYDRLAPKRAKGGAP